MKESRHGACSPGKTSLSFYSIGRGTEGCGGSRGLEAGMACLLKAVVGWSLGNVKWACGKLYKRVAY